MKYNFSKAIINNIINTFTYAYTKNAFGISETVATFDPVEFFEEYLMTSPFDAFMALDGFAFKKTLATLKRYDIPYTPEQERKAKVYYDVTEQMRKQRKDCVYMLLDDIDNTGIVRYQAKNLYTTQKTLDVAEFIERLPVERKTFNVLYKDIISDYLLNSKEQYEALKNSLNYHVTCLIGGAGTGKSFVTAAIVDQLVANGKVVAILAPTHKAKEALQQKLNTGTVRTIHSFVHKPSECDAIIIDESGMISTPLLHSLRRVYNGQQLIFVGDKNQLPPIDYGRPFERLQKRFKTVELTDNKRSESRDIIALANEVLGRVQNDNLKLENIEIVSTAQEAFKKGAEVALTYRNTDVKAINESQRKKDGKASISPYFAIGDEIIAKTNDERFFNGQLFTIIDFDKIKSKVNGRVIKLKSDRDLEYNFDFAYGLTIHKSQGSEWDYVAYKPSELDTENLAYVAITRAKKKLFIIGDGLKSPYRVDKEWAQIELNSV